MNRITPLEPRGTLWPAIAQKLAPPPVTRADAVVPAANDPVWQRLRRWQWIGSGALAASVLLATALGIKTPALPAEPAPRFLAVLQAPSDGATGWIVKATRGGQLRLIPAGPMAPVPAGRSLQFWTKPESAASPTSLGWVEGGRTTELSAGRLSAVDEKQLFEVTLEAQGGSTIGLVLFVGRMVRM